MLHVGQHGLCWALGGNRGLGDMKNILSKKVVTFDWNNIEKRYII